MTSTFTTTLRGASVARLLQEMAAMLCGGLGMSSLRMLARLARRFNRSQFQRPEGVVNHRPADAGKYGFIGHIIDWLTVERTKIRSEECWPSATFS